MITADLLSAVPLFATLPETERATIAAHAADVRLQQDEWLVLEGMAPAFFALIEGSLAVFKHIAGEDRELTTYAPGDFFGEVPLLLGSSAIASLKATTPSRVLRIEPDDFHRMITTCAKLNGEILRMMALRVGRLQQVVIDTPASTVVVVGHRHDLACHDVRDFLSRNRIAFTWVDPGDAAAARELPADFAAHRVRLPAVLLPDESRLEAPSFRALAEALGLQTTGRGVEYDLAIIGAGPSGLAAAVYGASEGLCTVLVERVAAGGQAGTSSRIENYLGFPAGLSGDELSARAQQQARRFGAELMVARSVCGLDSGLGATSRGLVLDGGERIAARSMILATGVQWRRLTIPGADRLTGRGVFYGASRSEAPGLHGRTVHIVGGGNSAGQAAMLFSAHAEAVVMLVRGRTLAASMSYYLIEQLASKENVRVEFEQEVVAVEGESRIEAVVTRDGPTGRETRRASDGLFIFIGARAETDWLPPMVIRDQWGYVCTGRDVVDLIHPLDGTPQPGVPDDYVWPRARDPYLLETSVPGIFAAGDVRHGSVKRVASGVGEGSMAVAFVHQYLGEASAVS